MISVEQFTNIVNIVLIVLFVLFFVGVLIAGLIGFKRGVVKESYYFLFTAIFIGVGICLLPLVADLVGKIPLTFLPYKSIEMTNSSTGQIYYVKITNLNETIQNCFMGYYKLFDVVDSSGNVISSSDAYNYAVALTSSIIKLISFFLIILVFSLLGFLLAVILWHTLFKRLLPKIVRKKVKLRAISTIESVARYVIVSFLLISPLSSIINVVNKSYKRSDNTTNETVQYLNGFMDTYNNSLFANAFFNWTVNKDGLTLDAQVMEQITKTTFNKGSLGIISSINDLTQVTSTVIDGFTFSDDSGNPSFKFDYTILFAKDTLDNFLMALKDSKIVVYALPIAAQMALQSDLLKSYFDAKETLKDVDFSKIDWANEIGLIQEIADDILDSGVIDKFKNEDGSYDFKAEPVTYVKELLDESAIEKNKAALAVIDRSELLSKVAIPVAIDMLTKQNKDLANYLPTLEEAKNIKWGFEFSTLLDILGRINDVDNTLIDAIFEEEDTSKSFVRRNESESETEDKAKQDKIIEKVLEHVKEYNEILTGKLNGYGYPQDIEDSTGVSNKGEYNLLDLEIVKKPIRYAIENYVFDLLPADENKEQRKAELVKKFNEMDNSDVSPWRVNYKKEFHRLFEILEPFKGHYDIFSGLLNGNIISSDLKDIPQETINVLSKAIRKFDNSDLSYTVLLPLIEDTLFSGDMKSTYSSMGLDADIIEKGFRECKGKKVCGQEIAILIEQLANIGTITECINNSSSTSAMISSLSEKNEAIIKVLDTVYVSKILNFNDPDKVNGKDANFYNLMNYVFDSANTPGFKFKQNELPADIVWANATNDNENEIARFVKFIELLGKKSKNNDTILDAFTDEDLFNDNAKIKSLVDDYNLVEIIKNIGNSYVISATMGDFLDAQLENSNLIDKDNNITFTNLSKKDWDKEGDALGRILKTIGDSQIQFNNLSLDSLNDIVGLNNLFHALSESGIFVNKSNGDYMLGDWILAKLEPNLQAIKLGENAIDIAKDPDSWDKSWGTKGEGEYNILKHDFKALKNKEDWCNLEYKYDFDTTYYTKNTEYKNYWDNPDFYTNYKNSLKGDEIDNIIDVIYWTNNISKKDIKDIEAEELESLLTSINNTSTLRICIYNIYNNASSLIDNDYFDFSSAYNTYLIDCDQNQFNDVSASRDLRQTEIDYLVDVYSCYKLIESKGVFTGSDFNTEKLDEEFINQFKTTLINLNKSNVFHRKGSFKAKNTTDGKYYPTVFQQMVTKFLSSYDIRSIIYSADSPLDYHLKNEYEKYEDHIVTKDDENKDKDIKIKLKKIDYLSDTIFNPNVNSENFLPFSEQETEIDNAFEVVLALIGAGDYQGFTKETGEKTLNFSRVEINEDNITAIGEVLNVMLDSKIFKDCVPNAIHNALSQGFSGLDGVNLGDASCYYFYKDAMGKNDFTKTFDKNEIDNICNVLDDYVQFNDAIKGKSITDISVLLKLITNGSLESLLNDLHDSYIFHKSNNNLNNGEELTVFEQTIKMLLDESGVYDFIYKDENPSEIKAKMLSEIKAKTNAEIEFQSKENPNPTTYNDAWRSDNNKPSEINSIINFLKEGINIQKDYTSFDSKNFDMTTLSPDQIKTILFAMNKVDLLKDGAPRFVKRGFDSIGISNFTKYKFDSEENATDMAYYDLHPFIYGGDRNCSTEKEKDTEIYRIYEVLENMANYETSTTGDKIFKDYKTIDSLKDFTDHCDDINGLFSFVKNSHILNTNGGVHNQKWKTNTEGISVDTRALVLFNSLNQNEKGSSDNLTKYITGATNDQKIRALTTIFDLSAFDEKAEANAVYNLVKIANSILDIDPTNYNSVCTYQGDIDTVFRYSYDAYKNSTNARSYLVSDIVSNLLQESINSEINKARETYRYYCKDEQFAPIDYASISDESYSLLNEKERIALNACFKAKDYFQDIAGNKKALTKVELASYFTKMDNSKIATILYLSEMHNYMSVYAIFKGSTWNYVSNINNEDSLIYSDGFLFSELSDAYCEALGAE